MANSAEQTTPQSAVAASLQRAAQASLRRRTDEAGRAVIAEVAAEAARLYPQRRPESRRRGSTPLSSPSSYKYEVQDKAGGGVKLDFYVEGDEGFMVKFNAQNFGKHHNYQIRPRSGRRLAYNRDDPASTKPNYFPEEVTWRPGPNSGGTHFWENTIRRAMSRFRL